MLSVALLFQPSTVPVHLSCLVRFNYLIEFNYIIILLIFRHVIVTCQGAEKFRTKFAMAKVLRSLQVQTESACVLLLQLHILAHTFQLDGTSMIVI